MPALPFEPVPAPLSRSARAVPSGIEALYAEHGATVGRWVLRLGGPRFDAEDAVQEVFAIAAERLAGFRGDSKLSTWLYGIAENVVREQRRRERVRRWFTAGGVEAGADVRAPGPHALEAIEQRQANDLVYRALDRMREPYRTALILFELEELSGEEIAELKGVKVATVWVWLHRGRAQLAKHFADVAEGR